MDNQNLNNLSENALNFLKGFTWAVPQAFSDAIGKCQFEEGDVFYQSVDNYQKWDNALRYVCDIIQVQTPPEKQSKSIAYESAIIFNKNWDYLIDIEYLNNGDIPSKRKLTTTQGRLFTFLAYGNKEVLDLKSEEPSVPILLKDVKNYMVKHFNTGLNVKDENKSSKLEEFILNQFRNEIDNRVQAPNMFIMMYDSTNDTSSSKFRNIYKALRSEFTVTIIERSLKECSIPNYDKIFPTIIFIGLVIDSAKTEAMRDVIKKVLWPKKNQQRATKTVHEILTGGKSNVRAFKLSAHGIFYSFKAGKRKDGRIITKSFKRNSHVIRYRVSLEKIEDFPQNIKSYLELQFTDCPNHLFNDSNFSASSVKSDIAINLEHTENHELINFAKQSRSFTEYKSRHENLEKYLLEHDQQSIATEIPVWIESGEFKDYYEVFKTNVDLTGHIDILRKEQDGRIGIWDYKPKAFNEKFAKTQVFLYAFMLAVRTGRSLKDFVCGYFDEVDVFYFEPSEITSFKLL